jgi:uncharacterized membrane protein
MSEYRLSTRDVAFVAVFAALSFIVCKFVPGIPIIGGQGQIKFDAAMAPIYGLVIGPYLGFLAALFGGFIAANSWFSIFTSFCTAISAMVVGLLTQKNYSSRSHSVRGWVVAAIILAVLIIGWYMTWVGQRVLFYPIPHLAGLVAILATGEWISKSFKDGREGKERKWFVRPYFILGGISIAVLSFIISRPFFDETWSVSAVSLPLYFLSGIVILYGLFGGGKGKFVATVGLASYCGLMADHMLGNFIYIASVGVFIPYDVIESTLSALNLPDFPSLFMYVLPISVVERIALTAIATMFGVGLVYALYKAGLFHRKL